jgi:hypothetical protein
VAGNHASLSFLAKHLVGVSCVAVLGVPGREVYYLYMASIVGKRQGNATYYYLVEFARGSASVKLLGRTFRVFSSAPSATVDS